MNRILRLHRPAPHEDAQRTVVPWQAGSRVASGSITVSTTLRTRSMSVPGLAAPVTIIDVIVVVSTPDYF